MTASIGNPSSSQLYTITESTSVSNFPLDGKIESRKRGEIDDNTEKLKNNVLGGTAKDPLGDIGKLSNIHDENILEKINPIRPPLLKRNSITRRAITPPEAEKQSWNSWIRSPLGKANRQLASLRGEWMDPCSGTASVSCYSSCDHSSITTTGSINADEISTVTDSCSEFVSSNVSYAGDSGMSTVIGTPPREVMTTPCSIEVDKKYGMYPVSENLMRCHDSSISKAEFSSSSSHYWPPPPSTGGTAYSSYWKSRQMNICNAAPSLSSSERSSYIQNSPLVNTTNLDPSTKSFQPYFDFPPASPKRTPRGTSYPHPSSSTSAGPFFHGTHVPTYNPYPYASYPYPPFHNHNKRQQAIYHAIPPHQTYAPSVYYHQGSCNTATPRRQLFSKRVTSTTSTNSCHFSHISDNYTSPIDTTGHATCHSQQHAYGYHR